jgi:hypothetical protein
VGASIAERAEVYEPEGDGRRLCGAKTPKRGGTCGKPAGWNTSHPGYGRCRLHGGMTPNHVKAALREQGLAQMRVDVQEIDVDPLALSLYTVKRFAALTVCYRGQMAAVAMGSPAWRFWQQLEREALNDGRAASESAIRAGVTDRQVRFVERAGTRIAAAFEHAIEVMEGSPELRAQALDRFVGRLMLLEQNDDDIDGTGASTTRS